MGLFSFIFGCKDKKNSQPNHFVEINAGSDEGWNDIFLTIIDDTKSDTSHTYIAKGLYKGTIVGLQITVKSNIEPGIINGQIDGKSGFISDAVTLKSIGKESDEFIKALSELYKVTSSNNFTKKEIRTTAFSLNEKLVDLDKPDNYKLKLFFEEDDEDLYSELFLNINTEKKEIEILEKDEEYRAAILKVLTQ